MRWGDQDSLGHINNVQIARLLEEARVRSMSDWFSGRPATFGMVVARQEIEFVSILHYAAAPARCEIWVSRIGNSSFEYGYRLFGADGGLAVLAETTVTALDLSTGLPLRLPDDVREVLSSHEGEPVPLRRRRAEVH